jgi:hypothetical protein
MSASLHHWAGRGYRSLHCTGCPQSLVPPHPFICVYLSGLKTNGLGSLCVPTWSTVPEAPRHLGMNGQVAALLNGLSAHLFSPKAKAQGWHGPRFLLPSEICQDVTSP